jgi:Icc protein
VPGEHDTSVDDGKQYLERYGKGTQGSGWYSFDRKGVHFVGLVNVVGLEHMGQAGPGPASVAGSGPEGAVQQYAHRSFRAHPAVGRLSRVGLGNGGQRAGAELSEALRVRHGLNGHIHQVMQKVEGHVTFHTAMSTAFPQPAPGSAPAAGPMKVPAERLRSVLGITNVHYVARKHSLAVVDAPLVEG